MSHESQPYAGVGGSTFCTFHVDHLLVGIEVSRVQEVVRHQPMTPVPRGPREVQGLINLRGQIVTAIDVRRWLDLPPREVGAEPTNAVVRLDDEAISLLVDGAGEVVTPPADAFEPVPPTASERIRSLFVGTYKLPERLLLVLDASEIGAIGAGSRAVALRGSA